MKINSIFQYAHHLGFNNPYYFKKKNKIVIDTKFESIIKNVNAPVTINPKALVSFFNNYYFLADNCIVNEFNRSPWMGIPNQENVGWTYHNVPKHQNDFQDEKNVADKLFDLLCEEIKDYVGKSKSVGILLSGGMDSRMVAGCVNHLIKNKKINVERVVAYNWGNTDSRDHIYAKRLANNLNWEFRSFQVGSAEMWDNFMTSGLRGCEYSGLHIHAMKQIADTNDVDVMLAGSYGDSVGRAEYSGVKVEKLSPINQKVTNKGGLLNSDIFKKGKSLLADDVSNYHKIFKQEKSYETNEIDRQLHYMRRMLNPCMEIINEVTPLFQIFTSPKVFGYMWSLDLKFRNDKVYYYLLKNFSVEISEIPWARTGKRFMHNEDVADNHSKKHHNYSEIVQFDLYDKILSYVDENKDYLSYINLEAFKVIMTEIKRFPKYNFDYLELVCWLVSYTKFVTTYQKELESPKLFNSKVLALKAKLEYRALTKSRQLKQKFF